MVKKWKVPTKKIKDNKMRKREEYEADKRVNIKIAKCHLSLPTLFLQSTLYTYAKTRI